ncbi:hypothetical protein DOM21_15010 [Bacteriovorax stolpii]|nr:hypothetical protein DOM21_15010 [Bacteriovorax stolpii]
MIKAHSISSYISRKKMLNLLSSQTDPESFIDVLQNHGVLSKKIPLKTCCEIPWVGIDYCIECNGKNKSNPEMYHQIERLIAFDEEWRSLIKDRIDDVVDFSDREYLKMISSQVKSLELNPVIPEDKRNLEVFYQYIGKRILFYNFDVVMEVVKKDGRPDLDFKIPGDVKNHIGEYKIWSRRPKKETITDQCLNYFGSDTVSGFVFVVNDTMSDIWKDYIKNHIEASKVYLSTESNEFILNKKYNGINIYRSYHQCQVSGTYVYIYHFIYDLHGNFDVRPKKLRPKKSTGNKVAQVKARYGAASKGRK